MEKKSIITYGICLALTVVMSVLLVFNFMNNAGAIGEKVATFSDGTQLTWNELKQEKNGEKYGYDASKITDTEIGDYAFTNSQLTSITITGNIKKISDTAFYKAYKLTGFQATADNEIYGSVSGILYEKATTTLYAFPAGRLNHNFSIAQGTKAIGNNAFNGCTQITSIALPNTVESIGKNAFTGTKITEVTISKYVKTIYSTSFSGITTLTDINVSPDNEYFVSHNGVLYNKEETVLVTFPAGKKYQIYKIPETVKCIDTEAFKNCYNLNVIQVPSSVVMVKKDAFNGIEGNPMLGTGSNKVKYIRYSGSAEDWNKVQKEEPIANLEDRLVVILFAKK